ncbi:hypothetical protein [Ulvibacterium sp.]|uniref:hypothetical protein n=1 Tax=Ulvibacterium sp. TaxID=2665914 RepID=UPI003BAA4E46
MTPSERFVYDLCQKSFLPFWSFPNPIGKKNKELCDVLVVCDKYIIIISVKDISVSNDSEDEVQYKRWVKKAVHDSAKQANGAARFIEDKTEILAKDRSTHIKLPSKKSRKVFKIAVAFGSPKKFPLPMGNFENGFVHVFDEESTITIINELDTITDFVNYLEAKEKFIPEKYLFAASEVDFLAFYIDTQFEFDMEPNSFVLDSGLWESYVQSLEYLKWQSEIQVSFFWDRMIKNLYDYHITLENGTLERDNLEEALKHINLEKRAERIELGMILENARKVGVNARMLKTLEGKNHTYVFMPLNEKNWQNKKQELIMRCMVARLENPNTEKIIGIGVGSAEKDGLWYDLAFLDIPELDEEFIAQVNDIKNEYGYFKNPKYSNSKDMRE